MPFGIADKSSKPSSPQTRLAPAAAPVIHHHHHHHHHQAPFSGNHSNNGTSDSFYSSTVSNLTPMTTDDDNSSTTSHRSRPRLGKSSPAPSPLGAFSHLSVSPSNGSGADSKATNQLRVRNMTNNAIYAGYLTKFSSRTFFSRKQWKRRYFILDQHSLHCFKSSDPQHPLLDSIRLCAESIVCVTDMFSGKKYCIQITSPNEKDWFVQADTAMEMSGWLRELKGTVVQFRHAVSSIHTRPITNYSDSSEFSDSSSATAPNGGHFLPANLAASSSPYDFYHAAARSLSGTPPPRPTPPHHTLLGTSLSPPPRSNPTSSVYTANLGASPTTTTFITSSTSSKFISSANSHGSNGNGVHHANGHHDYGTHGTLGSSNGNGYSSMVGSDAPVTRRRKNSSISSGSTNDYMSFGAVMEQAGALPVPTTPAYKPTPVSELSLPAPPRPSSPLPPASLNAPRGGKRESAVLSNHRVSIIMDRERNGDKVEAAGTIPRRSSHRTSPSRPMSPNLPRSSPRSSLVVSPPPRSILRPTSVSVRHSTQISLPMAMPGGPTHSLPPTPRGDGSLSRVTSMRSNSTSNRDSIVSTDSNYSMSSTASSARFSTQTLPSHARPNRSMRASIIPASLTTSPDILNSLPPAPTRPLSPTPSPTMAVSVVLPATSALSLAHGRQPSPPPVPPGGPSAGVRASIVFPLSTPAGSGSTDPTPQRRLPSVVPRHLQPEIVIPNRSQARARSQSNEGNLMSGTLNVPVSLTRRATTPSPRLGPNLTASSNTVNSTATTTTTATIEALGSQPSGPLPTPTPAPSLSKTASPVAGPTRILTSGPSVPTTFSTSSLPSSPASSPAPTMPMSPAMAQLYRASKQMSLPINNMYILPKAPTGPIPAPSVASGRASYQNHKQSLSNSSLISGSFATGESPITNTNGGTFGGGVARKSSGKTSGRFSTLGSVVILTGTDVPQPPTTALPPIPLSAPPTAALPIPLAVQEARRSLESGTAHHSTSPSLSATTTATATSVVAPTTAPVTENTTEVVKTEAAKKASEVVSETEESMSDAAVEAAANELVRSREASGVFEVIAEVEEEEEEDDEGAFDEADITELADFVDLEAIVDDDDIEENEGEQEELVADGLESKDDEEDDDEEEEEEEDDEDDDVSSVQLEESTETETETEATDDGVKATATATPANVATATLVMEKKDKDEKNQDEEEEEDDDMDDLVEEIEEFQILSSPPSPPTTGLDSAAESTSSSLSLTEELVSNPEYYDAKESKVVEYVFPSEITIA